MADIRLAKPAAGTSSNIVCAPEARFIFDFPTDEAVLSREGDNLVITFEDGSTLQLVNFYTAYSSQNMPTFEVQGAEISGEDFFTAMNEPDLMPAAGPGRAAGAQGNGNRFHDYVTSDLLDGLDRLGGLDIGWPGEGVNPDTDGAATRDGDINYEVTLTPGDSGDLDDDIPVIDNPDNPHDGNADPSAGRSVLSVNEAGLRGASSVTASGHMLVDAPDGVASIVIGGIVVFDGSALTGQVVPTDEGYLEVTGFNAASGRLDYTYHLTQATQEHSGDGADKIAHDLVVTVTDRDGSTDTGVVTVVITDDVPTIESFMHAVTEGDGDAVTGNALEGAVAGADGANFAWTNPEQQGRYGKLTLNEDGTYTYKLGDEVDVPKGETYTEQFTYTIKDADGDTSTATLTIAIKGDEIVPANPGSATIVVDEGALSTTEGASVDGSGQHEGHGWKGTGSFTVDLNGEDGTVMLKYGSGPDAPNITVSLINGEDFTSKWLSHNTTLTVNGVTVEVTGATQDDETGKWNIEYSYRLTGQQTHTGQGVGEDDALSDDIDITVTDATGDTSTGLLTVTVHDDGPVASADMNRLAEEAESVSGNVLENDESGADGWRTDAEGNIAAVVLKGSADGTYGTLTLNADGSYTYTRNETGVPDGGASDTFTYIAYDADGDAVEKTLTITIENTEPTTPEGEEHKLTVTLSDAKTAGGNSDTVSQSVDLFDGPEAFTTAVFGSTEGIVVSGGESFTWKQPEANKLVGTGSESGAVVTLTITGINADGTVTVTATLEDPAHHNDGSNSLDISGIVITATDAGGSTVSGTMNVVVTDDTATGQDDVNSLAEEADSVSGNVLENDKSGADGWRMDGEGNVAAVELKGSADGTYGTLSLNADGSYTYTRNETGVPDGGASDTFTYIAYDADGDAVEKTLTITIENTEPTTPEGEEHKLTVTLSDAKTAGGNSDTVSQSVDLFDGPEAFTTAVFGSTEGIVVSGGESFTWKQPEANKLVGTGSESGAVVTLTITGINADGTVTVTATLEDPAHHNDGSNSLDISGIVITATDAGGSMVSGTMNVVVTDDAVEVENLAGSSLTVDESYADHVAGPGLELEGSANTDTVSLDVSNLF
uniref:Ig-like domain-containing protein n=1 Tax=uncultured Mailhella sp. TaxID=1981031 RepID=UPI0025D2F74F